MAAAVGRASHAHGRHPVKLDEAATECSPDGERQGGRQPADRDRPAAPELIISARGLASSLGVTRSAEQAIRIATMGDVDQNAAKFSLSDRQIPIRVRLATDARRDINNIRNLPVPTGTGGSVPLERVADISFGMGPTSIQRYNQDRRVFVTADLAPGFASGDVESEIYALPIMQDLPAGVARTPVGSRSGKASSSTASSVALGTGILVVLSVRVLLYRRLYRHGNMGFAVPGPLGGRIALWLLDQRYHCRCSSRSDAVRHRGQRLDPRIDFALEEMASASASATQSSKRGTSVPSPIVMTTVWAMVAACCRPAFSSQRATSAWRAPMGTVVIGGLLVSTALTLLIVPAGFSLADSLEKRLGPWLRERLLTYNPGDESARQAEAYPAE